MSKKKILFVVNSLYGGGAERVFQTIINNLDYSKYNITVYSLHEEIIDDKIYLKPFKLKKIYHNINYKSNFPKKVSVKLRNKLIQIIYENFDASIFYRLFIRGIYDIEVAFIEGYSTRIVAGSNNKNSKKLAWVHVDLIHTPWTDIAFHNYNEECKCYQKFDKILCVSNDVKESFERKYNIHNRVQVQYNPINEDLIKKKSIEKIFVEVNNNFQFITIGRLEEQKGYKRLLRVINILKKDGYKFNVWILGEGTQKKELLDYINKNKLQEYVFLMGYQENPYPYIRASDAFICSSYSEGFSTVVTEAMILEKPIFTTDCAGMKELFLNEECGIICANEEEDLLEMLRYVLSNKHILKRFDSNLKIRKEAFKLKSRMKEIEELLDEK